MTAGIRVRWDKVQGIEIGEREHFYGIDVGDLDHIPKFTRVQAFWPKPNGRGGTGGEWVVDAKCERPQVGELHLVVTYDKEKQLRKLSDDEFYPGTNTIILRQGEQKGHCEWEGAEGSFEVEWEAFKLDLGAGRARPHARYHGSRREAGFREMILTFDDHRCVLTCEATTHALDAAHLIPAAMGENDVPPNGITLRADLHRLFDAGLFTFAADGRVEIAIEVDSDRRKVSEVYRRDLRSLRLRAPTLARVRETLALPEFRNRPRSSRTEVWV